MCGSYVLNVVRKVCGELGQLSANVNGCATMIYNTAAERWGVVGIFEVVNGVVSDKCHLATWS